MIFCVEKVWILDVNVVCDCCGFSVEGIWKDGIAWISEIGGYAHFFCRDLVVACVVFGDGWRYPYFFYRDLAKLSIF